MLDKPLEAIDEATLNSLVTTKATEGRHLEFKSELPSKEGDAIREFLADVSSFSNSQGGHLLFGVAEAAGAATAIAGVAVDDTDAELLRLENLIRDGMDPRLIGVRLRWVPLASGRHVLVIRVAAGVTAPHRIIYRNSGKFFARNSAGKYEMDVHELRHAFTEAENVPRRFRQLHAEAIERAQGVDMPFSLAQAPTAVLSLTPLSIFRADRDFDLNFEKSLLPFGGHSYNYMQAIEGLVNYIVPQGDDGSTNGMTLTHRTGRIDAAWNIGGIQNFGNKQSFVIPKRFEQGLLDGAVNGQVRLKEMGIDGPWVVFVSIYGAKGFQIPISNFYVSKPCYKDQALLGEIRLDNIDANSLLPIAKRFWLLFGEQMPDGKALGQF